MSLSQEHNDLLAQIELYPAVIFDLDGTLFNSEIRHVQSWNHVVHEFNCEPLSEEHLLSLAGWPTVVLAQKFIDDLKLDIDAQEITRRKIAAYQSIYIDMVEPFDLFTSLLKELSAKGKRVAVATGSSKFEATFLLQKHGLMPYVHTLMSSDMVSRGKPNPDIYLEAAKGLNVKPQDCLVFEDTSVGMTGAKNAAMDAIKVLNGAFDCTCITKP